MSDLFFSDHGRSDMSLATILALLAIFFGGRVIHGVITEEIKAG